MLKILNVAPGNFFHGTFRFTNSLVGPGITLYCSMSLVLLKCVRCKV